MECSKNCPVLIGFDETIARLQIESENITNVQLENEKAAAQNQTTARLLKSLPPSPEVTQARSILQEAVIQAGEAHEAVTESIGLLDDAIEANKVASDAVRSNCQGEPIYTEDPLRSGSMILTCASPGFSE